MGCKNGPVREGFKVRRPLHRGNPTLSAWEVLIQWHGEPLQRKTARLQWMTRTSLGATSSSRRSTTLATTASTTVGSSSDLIRSFRRESVFVCSGAGTAQVKLTESFRPVGYPHLVQPACQSRYLGCGRCCMRQLRGATGEN